MDPEFVNQAFLFLGVIIVGFVIFFFLPLPDFYAQEGLELTNIAIEKEEFSVGEKVGIDLAAKSGSGVKEIVIEGEGVMERIDCGMQQECVKRVELVFKNIGNYSLKIKAIDSTDQIVEEPLFIRILDSGKRCADQTLFGQCSSNKPFRCVDGEMLSDCERCGCGWELKCEKGVCVGQPIKLDIAGFSAVEERVLEDEKIEFNLKLGAPEKPEKLKGVSYKLKLDLESGEERAVRYFDIVLGESSGCCGDEEFIINDFISGATISAGNYSATVSLLNPLEADENKAVFDSIFLEEFVSVFERDEIAPIKPLNLRGVRSDEGIELSWNSNSEEDLAYYKIYKSTDVEELFILYNHFESVDFEENSLSVSVPDGERVYFAITAVDLSGNESEYSENILVD